jgi:hypothetical protein
MLFVYSTTFRSRCVHVGQYGVDGLYAYTFSKRCEYADALVGRTAECVVDTCFCLMCTYLL